MSSSTSFHDVTRVRLKRAEVDGQHWTTLVIEYTAHGYGGPSDEYMGVKTTFEVILHHNEIPKLPFKIENKVRS